MIKPNTAKLNYPRFKMKLVQIGYYMNWAGLYFDKIKLERGFGLLQLKTGHNVICTKLMHSDSLAIAVKKPVYVISIYERC